MRKKWCAVFQTIQLLRGPFNNYVDKMRGGRGKKMSIFVHAQGVKTVHAGGRGQKMTKFCPHNCWMPLNVNLQVLAFSEQNWFMNRIGSNFTSVLWVSIVFSMEVMHFSAKRGRTCHLIPISVRISTDDWHANEGKP